MQAAKVPFVYMSCKVAAEVNESNIRYVNDATVLHDEENGIPVLSVGVYRENEHYYEIKDRIVSCILSKNENALEIAINNTFVSIDIETGSSAIADGILEAVKQSNTTAIFHSKDTIERFVDTLILGLLLIWLVKWHYDYV